MEILFSGGLQIRSKDSSIKMLNTGTFVEGDYAFHNLYPGITSDDFPIAQDCFGDQFFIRNGTVIKLMAETGDVVDYQCTWEEFLNWVNEDPVERLDLPNDLQLEEGKLLFAYPPFCTEEGKNASIKPIDGLELILFHADFARQINGF